MKDRRRTRLLALLLTGLMVAGMAMPPASQAIEVQAKWSTVKTKAANGVFVIKAMKATGYGKMRITGFKKVSTNRWRATFKLIDKTPSPTAGVVPDGAQATTVGFCWPWDNGYGSGCASWNNSSTWNWSAVFHSVIPGSGSTFDFDRQWKCASGAIAAGTFSAGTKSVLAAVFGIKDQIKVTPQGYALSVVGGCVIKLFNPW